VRAAALLQRKLRALDRELGATIPRVLAGGDDEAIHDFRVAMRRIRTLLKLGRPVLGRFHADAVRAAFAVVMRATGELRDEEVLEETIGSLQIDEPTLVHWLERRKARETSLRRAVVDRVRRGEVTNARAMLRALLTLPPKPSRDRDLVRFAAKCVARSQKQVDALRDVDVTDVDGMHALRIAYKELRYTAELLVEGLPVEMAGIPRQAAQFQKRLGTVHDLDVALGAVARARSLSEELRARALEALRRRREEQVDKFRVERTPTPEDAMLFI
jgi:CHAD domain-containing protein